MPTITVRNIEPDVRDFIRQEGASNNRSMEAEVRHILTWYTNLKKTKPIDVAKGIHKEFQKIGGADDLVIPEREILPSPVAFKE